MSNFISEHSNFVRAGLLSAVALLLLIGFSGCVWFRGHFSDLNYKYVSEDEPTLYKRFERHPERDFLHHWFRRVYHKPSDHELKHAVGGYRSVKENWGEPDFIRKPFISIEDQYIGEWLYLNKARIFQFRGTQLVYEGPLTDFELTLLRRGYPDSAVALHTESAPRTDIFVYHNVFRPSVENFKFSEGRLVQSKEGD